MDDLISRQAAIDAVKKNTFRLIFAEEQNCEGHVAWSAQTVYSDVIEGALLDLPSAQPEWIQFDDGVPEEKYETGSGRQFSDYVLITVVNHEDDDETYVDVAYTVDGDWKTANRDAYIPKYCEITAWMPLPEPYRAERRTDERSD